MSQLSYAGCAVTGPSGIARCWGANNYGQMGNGENDGLPQASPLPVCQTGKRTSACVALTGVIESAVALTSSCWLTVQGGTRKVFCAGNAEYGQLGSASETSSSSTWKTLRTVCFNSDHSSLGNCAGADPLAATSLAHIAAGEDTYCVSGGATDPTYCWGAGTNGARGDGTMVNSGSVTEVCVTGQSPCTQQLLGVTKLAGATTHFCAIVGASNEVWCWGDGQVRATQVLLAGSPLVGASAISAGSEKSCAVVGTQLYCWATGQPATAVSGFGDVVKVSQLGTTSPTGAFMCAVTTTGRMRCLGKLSLGANGDWLNLSQALPACALMQAGTIRCWGNSTFNQTGGNVSGSNVNAQLPQTVCGATGTGAACAGGMPSTDFVAMATGEAHACGVHATGAVSCWGNTFSTRPDSTTLGYVNIIGATDAAHGSCTAITVEVAP